METKQVKLLAALAKRIKSEQKDKVRVISSLQSAKILTKQEIFTDHLKNLNKFFSTTTK